MTLELQLALAVLAVILAVEEEVAALQQMALIAALEELVVLDFVWLHLGK